MIYRMMSVVVVAVCILGGCSSSSEETGEQSEALTCGAMGTVCTAASDCCDGLVCANYAFARGMKHCVK